MRAYSLVAATLAIGLTTAQDLATVLAGQESLSSLVGLLSQVPDTTEFLASEQDVTLFAPNNDAIASILQNGAGPDDDLLDQVLRYHLYSGVIQSGDISDVPQLPMSYLETNVTGGQVASVSLDQEGNAIVTSGLKAVSPVTVADIRFDNGIIHVVDSVLTVPLGVSATLGAGGFTALAGAATQADLVGTLEGLSDVTIFAPNNDAFQAIAAATADLTFAQLIEILQYHVISGTAVYSNLLGNASVPTLQGTFVDITVSPDGAVFVDGARVINSDVIIANGVLHVIDAVLNPDEEDPQPGEPGFPTGDADSVPFTSGLEPATSINSELSGTTSLVAAILVTAAPEPTTYLLPNGSLSTDAAGMATETDSSTAMGSAATGSAATDSAATGSAGTASATTGSSSSASESAAQQTENAGMRKELPALAAAVAFGAVAFAMDA